MRIQRGNIGPCGLGTALLSSLAVLSLLVLASPGSAQRVEGRAVDAAGHALTGATIHLVDATTGTDLLAVPTDSAGAFAVPLLRSGSVRLRAEALGYRTSTTDVLDVGRDEVVVVELRLSVDAIALEPMVVTARRRDVHRAHRDFHRRSAAIERTGFGHVLDRETLEKTFHISSRLVEVPNLRKHYDRDGNLVLGNRLCTGGVFLNGMYVGNPSLDDLVFPTDLEGIELYRSEAEVPPELAAGGGRTLCTVAALWTRVGTTASSERSYWMRMGLFGALVGGFVLYVTTN